MLRELHLDILTPKSLTSREEARLVLDLLCGVCGDLVPERYGSTQPFRNLFNLSNREEMLDRWWRTMFWTRKRPRGDGGVLAADRWGRMHGWITASVDASKADVNGLMRFVQVAASRLSADFALLHLLTEHDLSIGRATETVSRVAPKKERHALSVTTHMLRKYLPDLYWATVFGPAYISHFGRDRILSAPAPLVRELEGGPIYVQLSESPFDLETDFAAVDAVRRRVKEHLNKDSFFDLGLPPDHVYNVPEFHVEAKDAAEARQEDSTRTGEHSSTSMLADTMKEESDPSLLGQVLSTAQEAVVHAKKHFNEVLDFSEDSVRRVEDILARLHEGRGTGRELSTEEEKVGATLFGSYIGEVMRRHWGGEWYWQHGVAPAKVLALKVGSEALFPVSKVYKRLVNGPEDDVWLYYQVFHAKLGKARGT